MAKKAKFGSFEAYQPKYENFERLGKKNDFIFQALAYMGEASYQISWANTVLEDVNNVPKELKKEIVNLCSAIHDLKEKLREAKKEVGE